MSRTETTSPEGIAAENRKRNVREREKTKRSIQAAYKDLPPIRYGLRPYDIATGERYLVLGPSAKFGAVRIQGSNGHCHSHDIAVTRLTMVPPVPPDDHGFISDRIANFTKPSPVRSPLETASEEERQRLIEHAMKLAATAEPTTVRSRRSLAREGTDPDTNIRAETERRHALRREPDASKKGQPYVLMIQHQKREKKAVAK